MRVASIASCFPPCQKCPKRGFLGLSQLGSGRPARLCNVSSHRSVLDCCTPCPEWQERRAFAQWWAPPLLLPRRASHSARTTTVAIILPRPHSVSTHPGVRRYILDPEIRPQDIVGRFRACRHAYLPRPQGTEQHNAAWYGIAWKGGACPTGAPTPATWRCAEPRDIAGRTIAMLPRN